MQFNGTKRYNDFSSFIKSHFNERVQKISINSGFTCPNRDGTKGRGGCSYCNNNSFNPDYCEPELSIREQLEQGIAFFSKRYRTQTYLAYFQAYTNTYADLTTLKKLFNEALAHPQVIGLVIGTRPDCISEELLNFLSELTKKNFISLEFGVESTLNRTLEAVNRCHTFEETVAAYELAKDRGIYLGAHMILGLPGESRDEMLQHTAAISKLPIDFLKLHQLQILEGTRMAVEYQKNPVQFDLFSVDGYIDFMAEFITYLPPKIVIERFISESSSRLLVAPQWGLKNFEFVDKLNKALIKRNLWQGKNYRA